MSNGSRSLLKNWKVVVLSLIGATTFWLFRALNKDQSALVSYPIEFVMEADSVVVIDPLPQHVKIDVSSSGWNLFRRTLIFSVTPIQIELDNPADIRYLTRATLLPIVRDQLEGLNINDLLTDTLFINVEKRLYKDVTIMVDSVNISLANRFRIISEIEVEPSMVRLFGPETIIRSLQDVYYVMPESRNIDEDISENVKIPLPFETLMQSDPASVQVFFEVDRFDRRRIDVPVEFMNFPTRQVVTVSDSVISISYLIQQELSEEFDQKDFGVMVDFLLFNDGDSTIEPILIYYPENALEVLVTPEKIKLIKK